MAARPTWQGHLRLSLVSPVPSPSIRPPAGRARCTSNMLHKEDPQPCIRMIPTDPELGPVERSDIVKGYEVDKDRYVVVEPMSEIDNVRLESTRTIDIDRFVDADDIDRLYWNDPYFLVPDGKVAVEAFSVIREAMAKAGKIALGRVVMHQRERLLAMEPRDRGIVAYTLRSFDDVRDPDTLFDDIPATKPDKAMIEIASKIIEQKEGAFEPETFKYHYEEAPRALIKETRKKRLAGRSRRRTTPPEDDTKVVDLMEALRKSLGNAGKTSPAKPAPKAARKQA